MKIESLKQLLDEIFQEIQERNESTSEDAIPLSIDFFSYLAKKYSLVTYNIPRLLDMLVKAKKIISFPVVDEDMSKKIRGIDGFVVTKGDVIKKQKLRYEEYFVNHYTDEFHKKKPIEKLVTEFPAIREDYINTPLGTCGSIAIMLAHIQGVFERNILDYSERNQEKIMKSILENSDPLSFFIIEGNGKPVPGSTEKKVETASSRRAVDTGKYREFKNFSDKNSIESTLKAYGVEFYTRVCFRDYQFQLMERLISERFINNKKDILFIKSMLERERRNSDQDLKLQEFAMDINNLMKQINATLKQMSS